MGLTGILGSSLTASCGGGGGGGGGGLEGLDSTGGFLGFAGVLAPIPLTGPLSCVPPPIFSFIVGRALVGVDLLLGMDIVCPFEAGSLSLTVFTTGVTGGGGGGGGGMEGCALLCDSTVLLIRAHSNQNVSDGESGG